MPAGAGSVLLCEYHSLGAPPGLETRQTVTDPTEVAELSDDANEGSVPPPGSLQNCPNDQGITLDAYFVYPGATVWLWADMGGCNTVIDQYGWSEDPAFAEYAQSLLGS